MQMHRVSASLWIKQGFMSWPWKASHHLKGYSYGNIRAKSQRFDFNRSALRAQPITHWGLPGKELCFEGFVLLFTPLILESQTVRVKSIPGTHLVHPLVLQRRKMFTCEKIARWSGMSQFAQLDSDLAPQTPGTETAAFSDDGKHCTTKQPGRKRKKTIATNSYWILGVCQAWS
jgi:hypothetical protein